MSNLKKIINHIAGFNDKVASYYGNRAAVYLMLHRYKEAVEDSKKSTHIDPMFIKVCSVSNL